MAADVRKICDPKRYDVAEAIQLAKQAAESSPVIEIELVRFLQAQCQTDCVPLQTVFRGLEVLGGMLGCGTGDQSRLITLLRPFLRSTDGRIASKCVLVLGRLSHNMAWLKKVMAETDARIRANLIESLWKREEPEVELVMRDALSDEHPRVVANAVYGLYLLGSDAWVEGLEGLIGSSRAELRKSGVWVLKLSGATNAPAKLRLMIRDVNPEVRHAAFDALRYLRDNGHGKRAVIAAPLLESTPAP